MLEFLKDRRKLVREIVVTSILIVVVLAFRSSVASTYRVPTGSMIPTILPGDHFFASQMAFGLRVPFSNTLITARTPPKRGQIVVFPSPSQPDIDLVKRAVAIGGDLLEVRDGKIILNGKELKLESVEGSESEELYWETIGERRHLMRLDKRMPRSRDFGPVQIPEGHFFVMGDNRDHSADSRYFGSVPYEKLRANAWRVFFSIDTSKFPYLRWNRFGRKMP